MIKGYTQDNLLLYILVLIGLHITSVFTIQYTGIDWPMRNYSTSDFGGYYEQVSTRKKDIVIRSNERILGKEPYYIYNNEDWVLKKIPFSHGYNNLGNPYYWYFKNESFVSNFFDIHKELRIEPKINREDFVSDNKFVDSKIKDVLLHKNTPSIDEKNFQSISYDPKCKSNIDSIVITPNRASAIVDTKCSAYLAFNSLYLPGWKAFIDGKEVRNIRLNQIFQGVLLEKSGHFNILFKFESERYFLFLAFPYLILVLCVLLISKKKFFDKA